MSETVYLLEELSNDKWYPVGIVDSQDSALDWILEHGTVDSGANSSYIFTSDRRCSSFLLNSKIKIFKVAIEYTNGTSLNKNFSNLREAEEFVFNEGDHVKNYWIGFGEK